MSRRTVLSETPKIFAVSLTPSAIRIKLAIERYSGIAPVELRTIRRQDPALARNQSERACIKQYRKAVKAAADDKLVESFKRLDQTGAIVACGLGEQADNLAEEYVQLSPA